MRTTVSFKTRSFIYDFAVDGGALGTIDMGVSASPNAVIIGGGALILETFLTGVPAGDVSVGFMAAGTEQFLIPNQIIAGMVQNAVIPINVSNVFMVASMITFSVTIGGAALTQGKMIFYMNVIEFPQP